MMMHINPTKTNKKPLRQSLRYQRASLATRLIKVASPSRRKKNTLLTSFVAAVANDLPPPPPKSDRLQGACRAVTFPPRAGRLVDGSGAPPLVGPWQALRALSNLIQPSSAPQIERSIVRSEIPSITSATPAPHSSSVHMYGAIT